MSPSSESPADADPSTGSTLSRRRLLGTAAAVGAAGLAGCTAPFVRIRRTETTVERRFDAAAVDRLRVTDASDDVAVERVDGDAVRARVHKRARGETSLSALELRSRVEERTLHLSTHEPNVVGVGGGSVDLEVAVPESVSVDRVESDAGDVSVRGTAGDPAVETGDGDVTVAGVGDISATTSDGDVVVEHVDGTVVARSTDGDVSIRDPGAVREVRSADGDVTATVPAVDGTASVRSADGDVVVRLGGSLQATVEATTGDGQVTVAGGLDDVGTVTGHRVVGTVGDGTNRLRVHSGDGDVVVTGL